MSKKILNKVISAILVLAICSTAFLGCVASAETYTGSYTIIGEAYAESGDVAKATVKIESENAFVAGIFTVEAAKALDFESAQAIAATTAAGATEVYPSIHTNSNNNKILFQGFKDDGTGLTEYKSIVIELTFKSAELEAGVEYAVNVKDVDVTDIKEATYNITGAAGFVHVHKYGKGVVEGATTTYKCEKCDAIKTETTESDVNIGSIKDPNTLKAEGGATITFAPNGDISLDFVTDTKGANVYLASVDKDGNITKLTSTDGKISGKDAFQNMYDGGVKTIGDKVEAYFIVKDGDNFVSKSEKITFSIADYCKAVIDKDEDADVVKYCTALLAYGKAANDYFEYGADFKDYAAYIADYGEIDYADAKAEANKGDNGWKLKSATIILGIKPTIRLGVELDKDTKIENLKFKAVMDTMVVEPSVKDIKYDENKNRYYIYIKDVPAKSVASDITLTANNVQDDAAIYNVKSYAEYNKENDAGKLAQLLVIYSDALAKAF